MSKKIIIGSIIVVLLIIICSLGICVLEKSQANDVEPVHVENISESHLLYGKKAVEIIDKYLDFEITTEETYILLKDLKDRENTLPDVDEDDENHDHNFYVEVYVFSLYTSISAQHFNSSYFDNDYSSILESRNNLAELVGMETRA